MKKVIAYSNDEVTILWKPDKCVHAGICVKTLPQVYNPKERPWVKPRNASSEELIRQVSTCPSGALSLKSKGMIKFEMEDDDKKGRFMVFEKDELAGEMTFTWAGKERFIIDHTVVMKAFGGKGYGRLLLMQAVEYAREKDAKIIPLCPFAKAQFDKNENLIDVLS